MSESGVKVNRERIISEFESLISIDSPSFHEAEIAKVIKDKLEALGLDVYTDAAKERLLSEDPLRKDCASNIYAYLKGSGDPLLFSAHLDTVEPGRGKKAVIHEDGRITSAGDTVLGADDVSGIVSILEALRLVRESGVLHRDIEVLFTVAEEPFGSGSRFVEYEKFRAKEGYVLDLTGPVGTAAVAAPSIITIGIKIKGRAAHAGFNPELGINALSIAAAALSHIKTGRVKKDLTVNFGTIKGGSGINIVPEEIQIEGEIRSLDHAAALKEAEKVRSSFEKAAGEHGGTVEVTVTENIRAYRVSKNSKAVKRFLKTAKEAGLTTQCIDTYGGSDANRFNENGLRTIVLACGMQNCHSTGEYSTTEDIIRSAELTFRLMTGH